MLKFNNPKNYSLFETSYGNDLPYQQLFLLLFETLPSRFSPIMDFDNNIIDFFKNNGFTEIMKNETYRRFITLKNLVKKEVFNGLSGLLVSDERIFVNHEKNILLKLVIKKEQDTNRVNLDFLYDISKGQIYEQLKFDDLFPLIKERKKSNITLIKSDMGHLDVEEFQLNVPEINLELNYGKDFLKIHDLIIKRLNTDNDKGIILLHGDPGTGKTSYIKYLTKMITDKEILFIPPSMAEILSEPSIIPFLMEHKNSILVIEDAERVISDRENNGSSSGVSNILNLTDGILGDCLGIQIIATFNMKKEKIDTALLRKGRLIVEHKFKYLSIDDTNKLLKHIGKDYVSDEEMSLSDIYNIDVESYKVENKTNKIGFI